MPEVILDSLQIVNGVALHPRELINVTEAVRETLEKRSALMSEAELQALEAEESAKTQVFETTDEVTKGTPETSHAPAPTKPTAPATSAPATSAPATSAPATSAPATSAPATSAPATAETGGVTITVAPTVAPTSPAKVETAPTK